MIWLIKDCKLN